MALPATSATTTPVAPTAPAPVDASAPAPKQADGVKQTDAKVLTWTTSVFGKINEKASETLEYKATDSLLGKKSLKIIARTIAFPLIALGAALEAVARAIVGIVLKAIGYPLSFAKVDFLNNAADATLSSAKVTLSNAKSALGNAVTFSAPEAKKAGDLAVENFQLKNTPRQGDKAVESFNKIEAAKKAAAEKPPVAPTPAPAAPAAPVAAEEDVPTAFEQIGQAFSWAKNMFGYGPRA